MINSCAGSIAAALHRDVVLPGLALATPRATFLCGMRKRATPMRVSAEATAQEPEDKHHFLDPLGGSAPGSFFMQKNQS